jgi:hypothetical protein
LYYYRYDFLKDAALNVKRDLQIRSFAAANFVYVEVFLKHHAAPRPQMVSVQLIDAHHVQRVMVLCRQPWLAGRCKTSTPCVSYADTHCTCISVTDKEHSALLRRAYKFWVRPAANSCKSGEPILHRERRHIKNRSFLKDDFKHFKSVGVPQFGPNLWYKEIVSTSFSWECPFKRNVDYIFLLALFIFF